MKDEWLDLAEELTTSVPDGLSERLVQVADLGALVAAWLHQPGTGAMLRAAGIEVDRALGPLAYSVSQEQATLLECRSFVDTVYELRALLLAVLER